MSCSVVSIEKRTAFTIYKYPEFVIFLIFSHTSFFSLESGFRNSGMTVGKSSKIVLATRSSHGLEVPLTDEDGTLLVAQSHFIFLAEAANKKLTENGKKHQKFYTNMKKVLNF